MQLFPCDLFKLIAALAILASCSAKKLTETTEENCEVCVKFLGKFIDSLDETAKSSPSNVETAFKKFCKTSKKQDNRFCYYVGGLEESATYIVNELAKPISWGVPSDKVCIKLYRQDAQICDLKYEKQIDLATANFKKMKVNELKKILSDWDEQCKGCSEKSDFIRRIEELLPKYDAAAAAARAKMEL